MTETPSYGQHCPNCEDSCSGACRYCPWCGHPLLNTDTDSDSDTTVDVDELIAILEARRTFANNQQDLAAANDGRYDFWGGKASETTLVRNALNHYAHNDEWPLTFDKRGWDDQ